MMKSIWVQFSIKDIDIFENGPVRCENSEAAIQFLISHRRKLHWFWDFKAKYKLQKTINFLFETYS